MLGERRLAARQMAHRPEHGAVAAKTTDQIRNRLGEKNPHDAQAANARQNERQRHNNDDLAKERKEGRLLGFAQTNEGALPHRLEGHEKEAEEKEMHGRGAFGQQLRIRVEHVHDRLRQKKNDEPAQHHVDHSDRCGKTDNLTNALQLACAIVVADDRLCGVGEPMQRQGHHIAHRIEYGHDTDINITAVDAEHVVGRHLNNAVGGLHDKPRHAELSDLPDRRFIEACLSHAQRRQRAAAGEKRQDPDHRQQLRNDSSYGGAGDPQIQYEDKDWIENNVHNGANENGKHPCFAIALCIDEAIHPSGQHHQRSADEIDAQISGAVWIGVIASAE